MPDWTPEFVLDRAALTELLARFGDLDLRTLAPLSQGWDRSVWSVIDTAGQRWVFGIPRRRSVVPGLRREIATLPVLAPALPHPIPVPARVGVADADEDWPFWGAPYLPGAELASVDASRPDRLSLAVEVAAFLAALHDPALAQRPFAADLPIDPSARADMTRRVPLARRQLVDLHQRGLWSSPPPVTALLERAEALPPCPPDRLRVVHGDLHLRHLVVDPAEPSRLRGVLDWIDLGRADPGVDLQVFWTLPDPADRAEALAAYGEAAPDSLLRAQVVALSVTAALLTYAVDTGRGWLRTSCLAALGRITG